MNKIIMYCAYINKNCSQTKRRTLGTLQQKSANQNEVETQILNGDEDFEEIQNKERFVGLVSIVYC